VQEVLVSEMVRYNVIVDLSKAQLMVYELVRSRSCAIVSLPEPFWNTRIVGAGCFGKAF
jgi:hypothetical protein